MRIGRRGYIVAAGLVLSVFALVAVLVGRDAPQAQGPVAVAAEVDAADSPAHQAVAVHGAWVIEVREPDGTLVRRREFENALVATGASTISTVLARELTPGVWVISVGDASSNDPCLTASSSPIDCYITESGSDKTDPYYSKTLTLSTPTTTFQLTGSATAQRDGVINTVSVRLHACASSVTPDAGCSASGSGTIMTTATVSPGESVTTGQQVLVTVTLSFS